MKKIFLGGALTALSLFLVSCQQKAPEVAPNAAPPTPESIIEEDLVKRGKLVYMGNCIACHNANPAMNGSLGPAIKGSSLELVERRVVHGDYPEGYAPKRKTQIMVALPELAGDLKAIHAFLNQ